MKKNTFRICLVAVITLAVYHLIVFLAPFVRNSVFWISYGFTLGAFLVATASAYTAFQKDPSAKSRFYGFPIARIGVIYGTVQIVVSLLIMLLAKHIADWVAIVVYAVALAAALLGLIGTEAMISEIKAMDSKLKQDVSLMRNLQSKVAHLAIQSGEPAVHSLAEEFRYADPVSNAALAEAEAELVYAVDMLQNAIIDGDKESTVQLCTRTSALLSERNRLCKLSK